MSYDCIEFALENQRATIVLNRPERLNALSTGLLAEMRDAVERVAESDARALLITGNGRGFSSGADLRDGMGGGGGPIDLGEGLDTRYHPMLRTLYALEIPVVCGVNGVAAGAGCSLALAGDIVIAARSAKFIQAFVRIGLMPDASGTWLVPRLVGRARALGAMMTGDDISAEQAEQWGMIWKVVDDDQLRTEAEAMADRLARGPTRALASIKTALRQSLDNSLSDQLEVEKTLQSDLGRSKDFIEGVGSFLQKRDANFSGE